MDHQIEMELSPTITIKGVQDIKSKDRWDENQMERDSLNAKVVSALVCALSSCEFHRVYNCEAAKEI